ncbi:MAG: pyridoxamine 5'-phosphate oxidase family protein [Candidatus Binatia bacterium]
MPRMTPDDLDEFLRQPIIGVLATLRRDGRPYTVPVWWVLHEGSFWISGTYERVWCKQLGRDPRASLCIESTGPPAPGFAGHVGIDGRVVRHELPGFDIWPISRLLVEKYVAPADPKREVAIEAFLANMKTEHRLLFELVPEVRRAIDMRIYRGKRADREYQQR